MRHTHGTAFQLSFFTLIQLYNFRFEPGIITVAAWRLAKIHQAYRPSTLAAHDLHFRTYLAYLTFMDLHIECSVHNILTFLEYLYNNGISPKVISTYLSSIHSKAKLYGWDVSSIGHPAVQRYICSISINSTFSPTPRGIFDVHTLYNISLSCDILTDPILFRAIFLTAFYGFLRMSNIAPHSASKFSPDHHFLRQDLIFACPGTHLLIKWTKTLQHHKAHHWIQLPSIHNHFLCPVRALRVLIAARPLPPSAPLFTNNFHPYAQVIDTHIRDALRKVLAHRNMTSRGHGFHAFRRSGATLAFDNNVQIQNIMAHGLWRSSAIWTYLENASQAPSIIPTTFAKVIPSYF